MATCWELRLCGNALAVAFLVLGYASALTCEEWRAEPPRPLSHLVHLVQLVHCPKL
jgi:hypothetical protein